MYSQLTSLCQCETLTCLHEIPYGTDPDYKDTLKNMEKFRKNSQFCDVILTIKGAEFPVHKVVLSSCSLYFEKLFTSDFPEKDKKCIELHDFEADTFELILNYMYSGHIDITLDKVVEVLKQADFLHLDWLKSHCSDFILKNINADNCIAFWKVGALYMNQKVELHSYAFARSNLDEVSKTPEFLELDIKELIQLIHSDVPTIKHTENSFLAATRWVQQDTVERGDDLKELLTRLRSQQFSKPFLQKHVFNNALLRQNITGANWLLDQFCFKEAQPGMSPAVLSGVPANARDKHLFITDAKKIIYAYNTVKKEVTRLCERPDFRGCLMAPYRGSVYVLGGKRTRTGLKYNVTENSWSKFPFRCYLSCGGVCVVNDAAYLTGGFMSNCWYDNVNKVDLEALNVERQPKMIMRRSDHGSVGYANCVYVCGGTNGSSTYIAELNHAESMDVREGQWRFLPTMQQTHGTCTAAIVNEFLYCTNTFGGQTERFDIRRCRWERIASAPGNYGTICAYDNKLYRVHNAGIAFYSQDSDSWEQEIFYDFAFPSATSLWKLFD